MKTLQIVRFSIDFVYNYTKQQGNVNKSIIGYYNL